MNLFLAITGRRPDGFHDLVSVVARIGLADTLTVERQESADRGPRFVLTCSDPSLACDDTNLVLRAAHAFAAATGWAGAATLHLEKRIPLGAGLGGGSSDAVAALRALNQLADHPLAAGALTRVAATLGSDCPLFLHDAAVVIRGRGERVDPLPPSAAARLRGRRVVVFKPAFGIATAWAYRRLAEMAATDEAAYLIAPAAEQRLAAWTEDKGASAETLLFNQLERPAFAKHVALPTLLARLEQEFGLAPRMTGSGSACFAFVPADAPIDRIRAAVRRDWGDSAFVTSTEVV